MEENLETKETAGAEEVTAETAKTYTEQEFISEVDRRVTQALKKQEAKNEAKVREAQKLASMNEEQKWQYELEQREKAILEKEKALALSENRNIASQILNEKGLSLSLVDFVVAEDAETMNSNIKLLDKAFKESVKNEVEKRLASNVPKKNLPLNNEITKSSIKNMSIQELQQLKNTNPEIFQTLK